MRVFALSNCDTCRKALSDLRAAGHAPQVTDLREAGADDLALIAAAFGDKAVNRSSTTWRGLDEATRALPVLDLISAHPTVIKRPVILHDRQWHQGWTPAVKAALGL